MADRRTRAWRRRSIVAASTVVVLGAGGYVAYAQTSSPTTKNDYRVASVARGSVSQTVTLTGTVTRVEQVTAKFPVSGTVTGLSVQVGQTVTAGQPLATIDQAPLLAAVTDAQAQLAQAQAQLTADSTATTSSAAQTSTAAKTTTSSATKATASASATGAPNGTSAPTQPPVTMPDQAPLKAAVAAMNDAAKTETTACAPVLAAKTKSPPQSTSTTPSSTSTTPSSTSTTPSSTSTTPSSTSTTPSGTSTTPPPGGGVTAEQIAACVPALQAWSSALAKAQTALQGYSTTLASVQAQLDKQAAAAKSTGTGTGSGSAQGSTGSSSSGSSSSASSSSASGSTQSGSGAAASTSAARTSGASSGSGSTATTASPQAILAKQLTDHAAIAAAENGVASAQSNLAAATLTAPIAGIVGQIGLTPGQGESGAQGITIVGTGAANVSVEVPLATIASIKQGDAATVAPPGLATLTGSVSQISLLPTSATTATPTYAVTVLLPDAPQVLATGSKVTTSIVTATAANVLTVPASAAQGSTSGSGRVDVLKDGQVSSVSVALGAVGGGLAEVRSGLNEGDHVVIANVAAPLPTNQSQFVRGLTGGGGAGQGGAGQGGAGQTNRRGG